MNKERYQRMKEARQRRSQIQTVDRLQKLAPPPVKPPEFCSDGLPVRELPPISKEELPR